MLRRTLSFLAAILFAGPCFAVKESDYGDWIPVYGAAPGIEVDVRYAIDKGAWSNYFWEFQTNAHVPITVHYTWVTKDGELKHTWVGMKPDDKGFPGDNNIVGTKFPQVKVVLVEVGTAYPKINLEHPGKITSSVSGMLEFAGHGQPAIWTPATQLPRDQSGELTFPGNGQPATYIPANPIPPDQSGELIFPGNGKPAIWIPATPIPPNSTIEFPGPKRSTTQ